MSLLSAEIKTRSHLTATIVIAPVMSADVTTQSSTASVVESSVLLSANVITAAFLAGTPVFNYAFSNTAFADTVLLLSDGFKLELDSNNLILGDYTPQFLESIGR